MYHLKTKEGYTLIEIVVSLAILSVSIVTILQLFSGGLRSIKISDDYLRATLLAQNKINELKTKYSYFKEEKGVFDEDNRYLWSLDVENYELANLHPQFENLKYDNLQNQTPIIVDKITLKVTWDTERKKRMVKIVTLKTLTSVNSLSKAIFKGRYPSSLTSARGLQFGSQDLPGGQSEIDYDKINISGSKMVIPKQRISGGNNSTKLNVSGSQTILEN